MRLLSFGGFATHGGCLEAIVAYQPSPALLAAAGGRPLCLAAHLSGADGVPIVWEGPRSRPVVVDQAGEQQVAVPVPVPVQAGVYSVAVEAVMDGVAWGSSLGEPVLPLGVERTAGGAVTLTDPTTGARHEVLALPVFRVPSGGYGRSSSERCVEVPWALSQYRGERRVLDVGYANAEPAHLSALGALDIPHLVGLDIAPRAIDGVAGVRGDVRRPPFMDASFDLIYAISIIEHVGRDNTRYEEGAVGQAQSSDDDFTAVAALSALLHPQGRLIVTVPYGHGQYLGWMVQYDAARLDRLVHASGLHLAGVEHYRYDGDGWTGPVSPESLTAAGYRSAEHSASAVACLTLRHAPAPAATTGLGGLLARAGAAVRAVVHQTIAAATAAADWWRGLWLRPARRWSG